MEIGIVTLGCDKNIVDTEYLAGVLAARGHEVAGSGVAEALDVLVVFTCGFILDAREESLEAIVAYGEAKRLHGNPRRLVVAGCLAQRWARELQPELEQVDAFCGVGAPERLADLIERVGRGEGDAAASAAAIPPPSMRLDGAAPRMRLDDAPTAFLKIADGCSHACAFCAIPAMKGPYVSVPPEVLLGEAEGLVSLGVRELALIAQDLAPYGTDLDGSCRLPDLLSDLCALDGDFRIRLLYLYPTGLTPEFIDVFAREDKICKYLDVPLQHLDSDVLRAMRRPGAGGDPLEGIRRVREAVPQVALRTTMIVGYPGETSKAFKRLIAGVQEARFDWLGGFVFSPEEGTPAATEPDAVDAKTAERRLERLMKTQAAITAERQAEQVGKVFDVLVEWVSDDGLEARGRSYREAPEVDGEIVLPTADGVEPPAVGATVRAKIVESDVYDLVGEVLCEGA